MNQGETFEQEILEDRDKKKDKKEIYKYISDKRILRVLFESKIYELREIQKQPMKQGLFFHKSFLICAPSGSGKTLVGELCAINNIFEGFGKSVYLVPFKALATEKYIDFKKKYTRFNVNVGLSIGDFDLNEEQLQEADIIVTTYEKMDSILRNFNDKEWIHSISTIIIDEIHMIGESGRGPRLESLIIRLNEFLHYPQIIGLSATIANPEFFNTWLSSLGNKTILIKSDQRPVPLLYRIDVTQNKDSLVRKYLKSVLKDKGQVLVFLNTRKDTQLSAQTFKNLVHGYLEPNELKACKKLKYRLEKLRGGNRDLMDVIKDGIAFHHAGLLSKERKLVEDFYRKKIIKVICCTTTLSAGVNTPARMVILKKFKKHVTSGYNLKSFKGYHETGDGFSFFKPFSANEVFQMLGRAGRPGLDTIGHGIILTKNIEEKLWIEDNYFGIMKENGYLTPKYNNLVSTLNDVNMLKEQVLLRVYEERNLSIEKLKQFFEQTFFWYEIKNSSIQNKNDRSLEIPIEQLLMIKEIKPLNLLKMHSRSNDLKKTLAKIKAMKITLITDDKISGFVKTQFGVFECVFKVSSGISCSCGYRNGISDNFANSKHLFEFCDHVIAFIAYLIKTVDPKIQKYIDDIIPKAVQNQYILNYLLEKGLLKRVEGNNNIFACTSFGKLVIRLYLEPSSGVLIREKLEYNQINTYLDILKEAFDVLKAEEKVRRDDYFEPLLEWIDEVPLDTILDKYSMMAGDLFNLKENACRIVLFMQRIAEFLSKSGTDIREKMLTLMEMTETLSIRIQHGIKEELFDLVLRLNQVGRVRARILFEIGYHDASHVKKESPYVLQRKTGLGLKLCKKIIED